jgi:hypothetical protein
MASTNTIAHLTLLGNPIPNAVTDGFPDPEPDALPNGHGLRDANPFNLRVSLPVPFRFPFRDGNANRNGFCHRHAEPVRNRRRNS